VQKYVPTIGVDYGVKPYKLGDYEVSPSPKFAGMELFKISILFNRCLRLNIGASKSMGFGWSTRLRRGEA